MVAKSSERNPRASAISQRFGAELAKARGAKQVSARQLQDAVRELGGTISRGTIAKIESGGREVTLAEVVVLAAALDVAPFVLLWPSLDDPAEELEITASKTMEAWRLAGWLPGFLAWRQDGKNPSYGTARFLTEFEMYSQLAWVDLMKSYVETGAGPPIESIAQEVRRRIENLDAVLAGPWGFGVERLPDLPLYQALRGFLEELDALH